MTNEMNNGRGFLKEKLGGYQVDPPSSVWNSISASIGRKGRRRMVILALSAAASLALAVTLGIHYFGPSIPEVPASAETIDRPETQDQAETAGQSETAGQIETAGQPEIAAQADQTDRTGKVDQTGQTGRQNEIQAENPMERLEEKVIRVLEDVTEGSRQEEVAVAEVMETDPVEFQADIPESSGQEGPADETGTQVEEEVAETEDEGFINIELADDLINEDLAERPVKARRWTIGAALSPLYSFRDAAPEALAGIPDHETGIVSYAGGVRVGYRASGRLAIESGVFFNKMGVAIGAPGIQAFSNNYSFAPIGAESSRSDIIAVSNSLGNIITKSGEIYVNNYKLNATHDASEITDNVLGTSSDQGIRQHLDYLEVPVNLRYTLLDRDLKIQLVGGMSTNLLVNNYVTMETGDGISEIGYLTNIRSVNYSGNAGIGFVYQFLGQISLSMEPRFRYFLNSVNDATLPATRPYSFGLYTGFNYTF